MRFVRNDLCVLLLVIVCGLFIVIGWLVLC